MRKIYLLAIFVITLFTFSVSDVDAVLLTIDKNGELVWSVLSEETTISPNKPIRSYIEVKKVEEKEQEAGASVVLTRRDGKISLVVTTGSEVREMDVVGFDKNLVEIEERPEVQRLTIGVSGEKFRLEQKGIVANTFYPIQIDAKKGIISVTTSRGDEFLSILPHEAVESTLRAKLLTKVLRDSVEINETDGKLHYKVQGEKVFDFLGIYQYTIPITVLVSASSGEIISVDSPTWFRFVKFLFI